MRLETLYLFAHLDCGCKASFISMRLSAIWHLQKGCLQASLRRTFLDICRMAEQENILFESLILAQDERWRRA